MKHHLTAWTAALSLAIAASAVAQIPPAPATPAQAIPAPAAAPLIAANGVMRATLDNGLRIVVVPDKLAPVVTTNLSYLVGSNDAPAGFPGTAHALEHMMFRGSTGLDRDQLFDLGALLGGNYNASTTETVTQYTYTVPSADLALALHSEALRMRGLTLSQADWEQERGAINQEVSRDLSSPFYVYSAQVQALLFAGSPYEFDALGSRASFDKTDAALLRRFYDQWYAPNNAILVIAGDVDPAAAIAEARGIFGPIARRDLPAHAPVKLAPVVKQTIELPTSFSTGIAAIAVRMPGLAERDFAAADILGDVLGSQRGDLNALVTSGKALSASFSYQPRRSVGQGLAIAAFPRGDDPAPVLDDLRRVLAAAAAGNIPAELVEASKRQELAQLAFEADSISGLANAWSRTLAQQGLDSPDDLAKAYEAVTVADVVRVAREVLDVDHAVSAVLTPQDGARPGSASGFGGAESFGNPSARGTPLPDWAAAALETPSAPPALDAPTVTTLPNGLRLLVQPETVSRTVSVYGRVRQSPTLQEPPGKDGVAALTAEMLDYGTQSQDRLAFRKSVDDIAARLSAGSSFQLKVLTPQFETGMRLLAENMLRPAFPAADFEVARSRQRTSVAGQVRTPDYQFGLTATRALVPAGDPSLRRPTPETVAAITLDDVRAFHAAAYRPDLTTIVVMGDVTPEEARRVVTETFGGWAAEGTAPNVDTPALPPNPASQARVPDPNRLQDNVVLAQTVGLPVASPDRYVMELGSTILGGGFSSRLYQDLRVRTGYVYSVSSQLNWQRTRATYAVAFGADPSNVSKARDLVLKNLRDMQANPVSDAELARAKAQTLRRLPMGRSSVDRIATSYLRLMDLGLPLNSEDVAARRYLTVTAPEIQEAFAKWLRPDGLVQVVEGPPLQQ